VTVRSVIDAPATRAGLDAAHEASPAHLRPIIEAVRDHRVGLFVVGQSADPFRIPRDPGRPAIVIIGDDYDRAVGPDGFHLPSVRRAIRECSAFAVVSCEPLPVVYAGIAASATITRRNVMLIETRPEKEIPWLALIRKLAPKRLVWLATVEGGHA
jgi:hypothetical protein